MAFRSRAGRTSGVCRNCSEMKDAMGTCSCTASDGSFKCKSCEQHTPNDEKSSNFPGYCQNCVDYYDADSDGDDD